MYATKWTVIIGFIYSINIKQNENNNKLLFFAILLEFIGYIETLFIAYLIK